MDAKLELHWQSEMSQERCDEINTWIEALPEREKNYVKELMFEVEQSARLDEAYNNTDFSS
jgi:hypothetical protein